MPATVPILENNLEFITNHFPNVNDQREKAYAIEFTCCDFKKRGQIFILIRKTDEKSL